MPEFILQVVLLVLGFALLIKGADFFVEGAAGIAARFRIPQLVIGLTIVAMGTSAPEAAVSITAALGGNGDVAVGNIVGSNILNILIILGVTALIASIPVAASTVKYEMPYMIAITVVLMLMGATGGTVCWWEGIILWVLFLMYLGYLFLSAMKSRKAQQENNGAEEGAAKGHDRADADLAGKPDEAEANADRLWKLLLFTAGGLALVVIGANISVDAATYIASAVGISDRVIALTIVAFGTSLPELCTSVVAARKGNADIAIGNIVGSNIFNILFIIGTTALITPVTYASAFLVDGVIAVLAAVLLLLCVARKRRLVRPHGVVMLAAFAGYLVYLLAA